MQLLLQAPPTLGLAPETQILVAIAIVIVVVALGGSALLMYRRRLFDKGSEDQSTILESLRAMRDQGKISLEEFDAARKRMAAKVAGVAPPPSTTPKPRPPDPGVRIARPGFDLTGSPLPMKPPDQGGTADKPADPESPSS